MNAAAPIGVFDSGVGGLSVLRALRAQLPGESFIYCADTAYCPYGGRPAEQIRARAEAISQALIESGVKLIVVACNTATLTAVAGLRARFSVPFVAMEPGVKPAAQSTRSGHIGVLATAGSLSGAGYQQLVRTHARDVAVHAVACHDWVEWVESGQFDTLECEQGIRRDLAPLQAADCDVLVLGCTHFPFLAPVIARIVGPDVALIDTGPAVARQVERVLDQHQCRHPGGGPARVEWVTSGDAELFAAQRRRLGFA
jgi:glutamate racemase